MEMRRFYLLATVSIVCLGVAIKLFPLAFASVVLKSVISPQEAIAKVARLSVTDGDLRAENQFHVAELGTVSGQLQNFIELECGGRSAFVAMVKGDPLKFSPYQWAIRRYRELDINETLFYLTPQGKLDGFHRKIAESSIPYHNIKKPAKARAIAEEVASDPKGLWKLDMSDYEVIDESSETFTGGMIVHTFVYEHNEALCGHASYRLRLSLSGHELTEVSRYVHIPEGFEKRYAEMRSANSVIAFWAGAIMTTMTLGGVITSALLLRQGWLRWRFPVLAAAVLAVAEGVHHLNGYPVMWMRYNTEYTFQQTLSMDFVEAAYKTLTTFVFYGVIFVCADILNRKAFVTHVHLPSLTSSAVAASEEVIDQVTTAYLAAPIELAYVTLFYLFSDRVLGWWSPVEVDMGTHALTTLRPAVDVVVSAFHAAVTEEVLLRTVPLALAKILVERFTNRNDVRYVMMAFAVGFQAFVFACAHANYPQSPSYARVVEIIGPVLVWGVLYLRHGLVYTVLLHYLYDLVLMSLSVFSAHSLLVDKILIVVCGIVPALAVFVAYKRSPTRLAPAPANARNASHGASLSVMAAGPKKKARTKQEEAQHEEQRRQKARQALIILAGLGLTGALLMLFTPPDITLGPAHVVSREEAIQIGVKAITKRLGYRASDEWMVTADVEKPAGPRQFLWEAAGRNRYEELSPYLTEAHWKVRAARLSTSGVEAALRSEAYIALVDADGDVMRTQLVLPEEMERPSLTEEAARKAISKVIEARYGSDGSDLEEVTAAKVKRPKRKDWKFLYRNASIAFDFHEKGQARVNFLVIGDKVMDPIPHIHVPQDYHREHHHNEATFELCLVPLQAAALVLALLHLVAPLHCWLNGQASARFFFKALGVIFVFLLLLEANRYPTYMAELNSEEPVMHQVFNMAAESAMWALGMAVAYAFFFSTAIVPSRHSQSAHASHTHLVSTTVERLAAGCVTLCAVGLEQLLTSFIEDYIPPPHPPSWESLNTAFPIFDVAGDVITDFFYSYAIVAMTLQTWMFVAERGYEKIGAMSFIGAHSLVALMAHLHHVEHVIVGEHAPDAIKVLSCVMAFVLALTEATAAYLLYTRLVAQVHEADVAEENAVRAAVGIAYFRLLYGTNALRETIIGQGVGVALVFALVYYLHRHESSEHASEEHPGDHKGDHHGGDHKADGHHKDGGASHHHADKKNI